MANGVSVSYEDVRQVVSQLKSGQEQLTTELKQLQALVDNLTQTGFVSQKASGAFQAAYQQFTTGATNAVNGLQGMYTFLDNYTNTTEQNDIQAAQAISSSF